ncbi:MAG: hypothetical protein LBG76_02845 [Treponema sp.]|jgi:hypothetical protein|nr:hypothetical protein [Treponema sp.]
MKNNRGRFAAPLFWAALLLGPALQAAAQDDFGFGFDDEAVSGGSGSVFALNVGVGGEAAVKPVWYVNELAHQSPGALFSGKLNFRAAASIAEGVINLNLKPDVNIPASIVSFDEAYVRTSFGAFDVEAGMRKLIWGKADNLGPLDVINPMDYTDLTGMTDVLGKKIPLPLIRASYRAGLFSKVEAVFIPRFEADRFAGSGRWAPFQLTALPASFVSGILDKTDPALRSIVAERIAGQNLVNSFKVEPPPTDTLEYAQGGFRFTTTIGPVDLGAQYYSGFLSRPAVWIPGIEDYAQAVSDIFEKVMSGQMTPEAAEEALGAKAPVLLAPRAAYNRYHQIGVDYAQVIAGFNLRAEVAAFITGDLAGDDGGVYNPSLGWSVGFDRDLAWRINFNFQGGGSVRLFHDKVDGNRAADVEAGSSATSTRLMFVLSRKFFRDELEVRTAALWGIEDMDCYIIPAVIWTRGALALELSGGIFGGSEEGELGQYRSNAFIRTALTYTF